MKKFKGKKKTFKQLVLDFLKNTKIILKDNLIVVIYIIGCILNGIILRLFTIGEFKIEPLLADLFISLIFVSFFFIISSKKRFIYLMILSCILVLICIANMVYYHYFDSFMSVTFISFVLANKETGDANVVGNLLQFRFFIPLLFPIILIVSNKLIKKREELIETKKEKKQRFKILLKWAFLFFSIFICTLKGYDYSRLYQQWNREYLVSKFGIYLYQMNDVIKSVEPQMASLFGADKANKKISDYYKVDSFVKPNNEYTGIFKDKNIIAIHAESIQTLAMEQSFNGKEVTPNLNKLAKEGIYFSNFYSQVSVGTSSDTEFTIATSLLPVNSGTVFVNYFDREYVSLYNLLQEKGYFTFCMHANTGSFWNRDTMYKALGYQAFYEKNSYEIDETIGFGLSDKSFFIQSVEKIKEISNTNEKFYGTLIMLSNHTPFEDIDKYGEFDVSMTVDGITYPYLEGTKLGNYFKSVRYADEQIGLLIDLLDKEGLLEDTVIIIYGDHDARIAKSEWNRLYNYDYLTNDVKDESFDDYVELDDYWYNINRRVPFIIWSQDENFKENYSKEIKSVTGMIDYMPTVGNMIGIYNKYALGNDMIYEKENVVSFPNGNYITNYVYYNDIQRKYKMIKDIPLDENYISRNKEYSEKIFDISNDIVVYNFFKKELSTKKYEGERK